MTLYSVIGILVNAGTASLKWAMRRFGKPSRPTTKMHTILNEVLPFMLIGLLTIITILTVLLAMTFALAYLTTLENKPKDHWFHLRTQLAHRYGRGKTAFYILPASFIFLVLSNFSSSNELDVVSQALIILAAIVWFFVASWGFLFSGKHVLENPIIIATILFALIIASWVFPADKWFFSMYGHPIAFLWGVNIFKYRAIRYANT